MGYNGVSGNPSGPPFAPPLGAPTEAPNINLYSRTRGPCQRSPGPNPPFWFLVSFNQQFWPSFAQRQSSTVSDGAKQPHFVSAFLGKLRRFGSLPSTSAANCSQPSAAAASLLPTAVLASGWGTTLGPRTLRLHRSHPPNGMAFRHQLHRAPALSVSSATTRTATRGGPCRGGGALPLVPQCCAQRRSHYAPTVGASSTATIPQR